MLVFVPEFPMTSTSKIQKFVIREQTIKKVAPKDEKRPSDDSASRVAQFQSTLYADQSLGQTIGGELLLGIGRRKVPRCWMIDA